MAATGPARPIHHVVMPVASLGKTRRWLHALGFTVAPDAAHPFGTKNACVFFADGTYLEPLAVADRERCEEEARAGNVFLTRDRAFRFRQGEPGFSGLALGTNDAAADRHAFGRAGIADGDVLAFSRKLELPNGGTAELGFRLAFANDRRSPDAFFFTCEAVGASPDRSPLQGHENGVVGISQIVLSEPNPSDFQSSLQAVLKQPNVSTEPSGLSLAAGSGLIEAVTPAALKSRYGSSREAHRGIEIEGVVLKVADMEAARRRLAQAGEAVEEVGERLLVRLSGASRTFLAFEAEDGR